MDPFLESDQRQNLIASRVTTCPCLPSLDTGDHIGDYDTCSISVQRQQVTETNCTFPRAMVVTSEALGVCLCHNWCKIVCGSAIIPCLKFDPLSLGHA